MQQYRLILDEDITDPPKIHEIKAAQIVMRFFDQDLVFVRPGFGQTPDFIIGQTTWELKSPTGNSKHTMGNNLRKARHQSGNIILDLTRCGFTSDRAILRAKNYLKEHPENIKRVIAIKKDGQIVEIFKR